ncbi:DUF6314 family protein [Algirhabdus cladophorae]|uniref:DUF6314 family protein n=1 Tax=Algirhabdus cladophorae TaxID=3377108 RepID=UPI003B846F85
MRFDLQLTDFIGIWQISREIEDRISRQAAQFTGQVTFTEDKDQLIYHETGRLKLLNTPPMTSERRYFWRQSDAGIAVFFDDDRPFHTFDLATATSDHWCDPDQYNVEYGFASWPVWTAVWTVKGPRKDYTMRSSYVRK